MSVGIANLSSATDTSLGVRKWGEVDSGGLRALYSCLSGSASIFLPDLVSQ